MVRNCRHFETQVKDQTTLEHLVGAVIAEEYLHSGRQIYNLDGGLAAVEIAVSSELPDGEPGHIKSLADLLEDRRFYTKDVQVVSPLHTLLSSGNWLPAGKQWEPILDRFGYIQRSPQPHGAHERANVLHAVQEIPRRTGAAADQLRERSPCFRSRCSRSRCRPAWRWRRPGWWISTSCTSITRRGLPCGR